MTCATVAIESSPGSGGAIVSVNVAVASRAAESFPLPSLSTKGVDDTNQATGEKLQIRPLSESVRLVIREAEALLSHVEEPRPCTCHPDDNPPVPCPQKFALSECRAAARPSTAATNEQVMNGEMPAGYLTDGVYTPWYLLNGRTGTPLYRRQSLPSSTLRSDVAVEIAGLRKVAANLEAEAGRFERENVYSAQGLTRDWLRLEAAMILANVRVIEASAVERSAVSARAEPRPLTDDEIRAAWNAAVEGGRDLGMDVYLHCMRAVAEAQRVAGSDGNSHV